MTKKKKKQNPQTDSSGNAATPVTRFVTVPDDPDVDCSTPASAPIITLKGKALKKFNKVCVQSLESRLSPLPMLAFCKSA